MSRYAPELQVALQASAAAAAVLARYPDGASSGVDVRHKAGLEVVTEVDEACEAAIREVFARQTPAIPVLGEEGGADQPARSATTRWVVDPIDGTANFVHGFPYWCVSIALEDEGAPVVGVILDPNRGRIYQGCEGGGAFCVQGDRRRQMRVSARNELAHSIVGTGFPYDRKERLAPLMNRVAVVLEHTRGLRRAGAAALDLAMVADGRLDAFWEEGLKRWDMAAGALLIREAGGLVTTADGGPIQGEEMSVLAGPPALHQALLSLLQTHPVP